MKHHARLFLLAAALAAGAATAAPHAHQHGAVKLAVAIDGTQLSIELEAPLDSLVGYERAPRTDAERRIANEVLTRMRSGAAALFKPDGAAQCALASAEVRAPVLEPAAREAPNAGAKAAAAEDEHADLDADYTFQCAQPAQLRSLEIGLFDAFQRIRRIEVQVAGPKGQHKLTLERPARRVELQR